MNVRNLVLGVGIFVMYLLVVFQGVRVFYPAPEYGDFCDAVRIAVFPETQEQCEGLGGKWIVQENLGDSREMAKPVPPVYENGGYCDVEHSCRQDYEEAREGYDQNFFVIVLVIGIVTLLVGYGFGRVEPVGSALLAGGVGAIFIGVVSRWDTLNDVWRFILLVLALMLLVWLAVQVNREGKWWKVFLKR